MREKVNLQEEMKNDVLETKLVCLERENELLKSEPENKQKIIELVSCQNSKVSCQNSELSY